MYVYTYKYKIYIYIHIYMYMYIYIYRCMFTYMYSTEGVILACMYGTCSSRKSIRCWSSARDHTDCPGRRLWRLT